MVPKCSPRGHQMVASVVCMLLIACSVGVKWCPLGVHGPRDELSGCCVNEACCDLKKGQVLVAIWAACEDHKYAEMTMNDKG